MGRSGSTGRSLTMMRVVCALSTLFAVLYLARLASSQIGRGQFGREMFGGEMWAEHKSDDAPEPEAEFHMARLKYQTRGGAGSHGYFNPWWAVDYPFAEQHFLPALRRLTNIFAADDSRHLDLMDDRIFDYPFLFLQQPGQGYFNPTEEEAARMREYFTRGGFMLVDDFHGEYEWAVFERTMSRVMPGKQFVEISDDDPVLHIFYDLRDRIQIPGLRHLRRSRGGQIVAQMEGDASWRGLYDDHGRLVVVCNFNMDMGDSWEHADDPLYPAEMTGRAYRLGVNYVIYSMTH